MEKMKKQNQSLPADRQHEDNSSTGQREGDYCDADGEEVAEKFGKLYLDRASKLLNRRFSTLPELRAHLHLIPADQEILFRRAS